MEISSYGSIFFAQETDESSRIRLNRDKSEEQENGNTELFGGSDTVTISEEARKLSEKLLLEKQEEQRRQEQEDQQKADAQALAARNTGRNEASGQSSAAPAGASGGSGGGLFQLRFQRRKHRSTDSAGRGTSPDHRVQFAAGKHQEQSDGYASVSACRTAAAAESGSNGLTFSVTSYAARPADSDESAGLAVYEHRSETAEYPNDFPTESAPPPSKIMTEQRLGPLRMPPDFYHFPPTGKKRGSFRSGFCLPEPVVPKTIKHTIYISPTKFIPYFKKDMI